MKEKNATILKYLNVNYQWYQSAYLLDLLYDKNYSLPYKATEREEFLPSLTFVSPSEFSTLRLTIDRIILTLPDMVLSVCRENT